MPDLLDSVFEAIENGFTGGTAPTAPPPTVKKDVVNNTSWFGTAPPTPPQEEEKDLLDTVFGAIENGNCPVPPSSLPPTVVSESTWEAFQTPAISSRAGAAAAEAPSSPPPEESPKEKKSKKNKKKRGWENKWETIGFFHNPMAPTEEHSFQGQAFEEQVKRQKELEVQLAQKERELKMLQQQHQLTLLQQSGDIDFLEKTFTTLEDGVCPSSNQALMIADQPHQPRSTTGSSSNNNDTTHTDHLPLLHPRRDHEPQFHGFVIHKLRQDYKSLADAIDSGMSTVSSALSGKSNSRSAPEEISVNMKKNKSKYVPIPLPEKDDADVIDQLFESFEAGMGFESSADALYKARVAMALQAQQEANMYKSQVQKKVALYKAQVEMSMQAQQQEEEKRLQEQKEQQRRMEQEQVRVAELETRTEAEPQHSQLDLLDSVFEAFELNLCAASTGMTAVH